MWTIARAVYLLQSAEAEGGGDEGGKQRHVQFARGDDEENDDILRDHLPLRIADGSGNPYLWGSSTTERRRVANF